jgi:hypothetical protein
MTLPYLPMVVALAVTSRLVSPANDKFQFWYAGHLVAIGSSPYDQSAWAAAGRTYGELAALVGRNCADVRAAECLWAYPPWTAWLFAPFGLLDPERGIALQSAFLVAAALVAVVLLALTLTLTGPSTLVVLLVPVIAAPFVWDSFLGHFEALELLGAVLVVRGLRSTSSAPLIVGAVLLALKPHLVVPLIPLTIAVLVARRAWRVLALTSGSLGALIAIGIWREPLAIGALAGAGAKATLVLPTTWSFAERVTPGIAPLTVAAMLAVSAGAGLIALRAAPSSLWDMTFIAASLALSLVLSPYAHLYDYVLLSPAIAVSIALADRIGGRARILAWLAFGGGFVGLTWSAFLLGPHGDEPAFSALIPVAALVALGVAASWNGGRDAADMRSRAGTT